MSRTLSLLVVLLTVTSIHAQAPEPLVKQVKLSIHNGVSYLVAKQQRDGGWETTVEDGKPINNHGGATALAVLALLNCEGVLDDAELDAKRKDAIAKGLDQLRKLEKPETVYVRSLQTMAFAEARSDMNIIKANVDWLIAARVFRDGDFIGWDYHSRPGSRVSDASNTQYALLALWYARQAGVDVPHKVWESIHDHYRRTQSKDGSWIYSPYYDTDELKKPSATMTVSGLCVLLISGNETNGGREQWLKNGAFKNCGAYSDTAALAKAQQWLIKNFTLELPNRTYYHLYGLERAGRLTGMRFFGEHDWYREGCELLVKEQEGSGAWKTRAGWDRWPHVNTSFALLFLSKGRTPVVMSKLVHGRWPRDENETDWNSDRNDLRHLTEYVNRTDLFSLGENAKRPRPVAWQTYDIKRAIEARLDKNPASAADDAAVVADMRQSPILYITGHEAPEFQGHELKLLKRYVENGGFIFAEACCNSKGFDDGIKELVKELWPGHELKFTESVHPVWTCYNPLTPGEPFKLMELQVGCRTAMLYSPQDLSCHWESNKHNEGMSKRAFELGANIIAYGTGRTAPAPRLTPIDVAAEKTAITPRKNGFLRVGQIYHSGDWQPAPRAMANVLEHVHKVAGYDVTTKIDKVLLSDTTDVRSTKLLYMHGRKAFRVEPGHLDALRFTLERGGLLLADACCGNETFDKSFRQFAQELFPKEKLTVLSTDTNARDALFGAEHNLGTALTSANIQCRTMPNGKMVSREPHLEGIRVNGRWVVLYSKYDLGCALDGSTSSSCVGYDQASALKIATAAILYNARP